MEAEERRRLCWCERGLGSQCLAVRVTYVCILGAMRTNETKYTHVARMLAYADSSVFARSEVRDVFEMRQVSVSREARGGG